jgi:hypothetical protein
VPCATTPELSTVTAFGVEEDISEYMEDAELLLAVRKDLQ